MSAKIALMGMLMPVFWLGLIAIRLTLAQTFDELLAVKHLSRRGTTLVFLVAALIVHLGASL